MEARTCSIISSMSSVLPKVPICSKVSGLIYSRLVSGLASTLFKVRLGSLLSAW